MHLVGLGRKDANWERHRAGRCSCLLNSLSEGDRVLTVEVKKKR